MKVWNTAAIALLLAQIILLQAFAQSSGSAIVNLPIEGPGPSSRRTGVAITEIMYKPAVRADGKNLEFVELYNSNPFYEDISGYRLEGQVQFTFPTNSILPGLSYVVIAAAPSDLQTVYGVTNVVGPFAGSLKTQKGSALLQLIDPIGSILLEVPYSKNAPWPISADGTGHSLVLARPSYGEGNSRAWTPSESVGGSPGLPDPIDQSPLKSIVINEFLTNPSATGPGYVELFNQSNQSVDISGCILSDQPDTAQFVIPSNTVISAGGFAYFVATQIGFQLNPAGGTLYLKAPSATLVLDAVQYEGQAQDTPVGRYPNGADEFYPLRGSTPGSSNELPIVRDVVINEIMYKPISGDTNDTYVELYNKGTNTVQLGGWRFISGITYTFPSNTAIAPDGYLVIAKNATNLFAHYPNLNPANTVGNFGGKLSSGGERLALAMPNSIVQTNTGILTTNAFWVVVDEVTYSGGGRWGQWASGGGSSLELIDPRSNHRLAYNWADSDESKKSAWTNIEATGVLDLGGNYEASIAHIQIGLLDVGECLVDNIEVSPGNQSVNYLSNSGFESGTTGWTFQGDHVRSTIDAEGYQSGHSVHLRCSDRIWTGANSVQGTLTNTSLAAGQTATLRFKARWLRGWPEALLRLNGNWLEATGRLPVPATLGTPGMRNSRAVSNTGPAIYQVTHSPALPVANQAVLVTARIDDPDGIGAATLNYRIDPATALTSVSMRDDGTGGDLVAGDGIYTATLPGSPANTMVAYYIGVSDSRSAASRFPALLDDNTPDRECLIRFGDSNSANGFGTYHLWLSRQTITRWSSLPDLSNEMFDGTFVYGNRVIYNMSARYAGSPYHQQFDSPIGSLCHYKWVFPEDDQFLGTTSFNKIHQPGNGPGDDNSIQREQTAYWMARQLGLPWNYRRYVAVYVNGNRRGTLMEDAQTPDADRIKEQFPKDSDGFLYKLQPWFEFDPSGKGFNNISWCTLNAYTTGGQKKLARYRWNFLNRRSPDSANNYTNVFALIDAANSYRSSSYVSNMESLVDMEEWMRLFAIEHAVGNWDSFGAQNAQNMYGYKPLNGKWTLFIWDYNIVLGNSGSWGPDGGNLFTYNGADPVMGRIYANPTFRRAYLRAFKDIANGPMSNTNANPVLDAKYAAFRANGVTVTAPTAIKSWITTMHSSLLTALSNEGANAPFSVSNNNGADFTTNQNYVVITGTAPVEVKEISINGSFYPVTWTSVANWTIDYSLHEGTNSLDIAGFDPHGNPVPNATKTIHATYQGQALDPAANNVVINEIMYHSPTPGGNYVEIYNRSMDTAFDLSGWQLKGLGFTFENGTVLAPEAYLVVVENLAIFDAIYGADIPVAGEWSGTLNPTGETLELIEPGGAISGESSIAKVKFESTLPWSQAADGFGSSLQLVDVNQSNDRVANWATISTNSAPQTPQWQHVSITGIATKSILLVGMVTSGDVYIDDLTLVAGSVPETGANNLQNGDFESPLTGPWTVSPNMANSEITTGVSHSGNASLHVVATSGGPTIGAAIWQNTATLQTNATYTLSYWYLPSSNGTSLLIRLSGSSPNSGHIYSLQPFPPPVPSSTLYTPGAINSVRAILPPISPITLNEIETVNTSGLADHNGTHSPWVELYNPGTNTISLADLYLTDSYTNLNRWSFPSTASLPAGGFSIIWLDGDATNTTPTELHSSFRPASGSGSLALVQLLNNAPTVIDYLNYRGLTADQSYGSFPDGSFEGRRVFNNPTPGSKNSGFTPVHVLINEWMAGNSKTIVDPADGSFSDWFELYNASNEVADLSGYYLSNSTTNKTQFRIPNGKQITPGGYLLIWADKNTNANTNENDLHVNFKLAKSGDTIALFDPIGTLIDAVSFGVQSDDISQGRLPDGADGEFSFFSISTPGTSNASSGSEYIMVVATIQAGSIVLNWNSQPGKVYEVQSKESLSDSTWQSLPPVTAAASITTMTNQAGTGAERFFRIARINQ